MRMTAEVGYPATRRLIFAAYPSITPASSSRRMRAVTAGCDKPTCIPSSVFVMRALSCNASRIFQSSLSRSACFGFIGMGLKIQMI